MRSTCTVVRMNRTEEQDDAAGGAGLRTIVLEDGTRVLASVAVFEAKLGYQSYAYLRFKSGGKNTKKYVGNVSANSRAQSLKLGWALVRNKKVIEAFGWRWEHPVRAPGTSRSSSSTPPVVRFDTPRRS